MPHWDFRCPTCETTTNLWFVSFAASVTAKCDMCGHPLQRLPSYAIPVFKGTGFYKTDYKK